MSGSDIDKAFMVFDFNNRVTRNAKSLGRHISAISVDASPKCASHT